MHTTVFDVAVIGAGPGGSAAAYYLARQGKKVLLMDKASFPRDKTCGDGLTPRALDVLDDMGILAQAEAAGYRVNGLSVFAKRGAVLQSTIPKHPSLHDYLLVVPRLRLDDIVRRKALEQGVTFQGDTRVTGLTPHADGVDIHVQASGGPDTYRAQMAVVAAGANMSFLREIGILRHTPRPIVAVRAYYEGLQGLGDHIQAHFEQVPMPGYGWVFPTGKDSANIGLGMWRDQASAPESLRAALAHFLQAPRMQALLQNATQVGAVKSYPLRIDFTTAPTFGERVLLVGESAGLVSPLTGEGIDFALETGKLAAEFLHGVFAHGDFSRAVLAGYDRLLRSHFQSMFTFLGYLRKVYVNPLLMDRIIRLCERIPDVRHLFVSILLSQQHPAALLRPGILRKVLIGV
ncbi:MAG: geranylgeranyl reductase family protein [Anaerolineales bacterium]|nr:geranylgeranyl reductase family protein [Anaerolineales bacterium]